MTYPRFQRARDFKTFTRTAGNLPLNSTAWADLPTIGTTWDIALAAQVGDVLEARLSGTLSSEAVASYIDVATIVSAAPVNYFATAGASTGQGIPGAVGQVSLYSFFTAVYSYTLVVGDISAGAVTCRLRYRTSLASAKTLLANADAPLQFFVKNLGPVDPH